MSWAVWLVIALVALAGELFTLGLYLGAFALSAVIVAALSHFIDIPLQIGVFALLSVVLLLVVRPVVLRFLPTSVTGSGEPRPVPSQNVGVVVQEVGRGHGQIRVGTGEFWSARPTEPDLLITPGRQVDIVDMDGLTALVRPVASLPPTTSPEPLPQDRFGLSERELEVLRLVALGLSNQEIADRLVLSPRTVHHHVSHILTKMDVDNRVEAVRLAFDRGLVQPEDR